MRTIGVDLGIRKLAFAVWDDDVLTRTDAYEHHGGLRQVELADLASWFCYHARDLVPDQIFIEETLLGNNVKYSIKLAQTMGAVLSQLPGEVWARTLTVNNKTWKREILGSGNADKSTVRIWLEDQSNAYSVLCGNDQDRFDAACIGYYGYIIARRAQALAESGFSHSSERP